MVEGTSKDKDITDLALKRPEWTQELRRAIDETSDLDLEEMAELASEDDEDQFVSIFESDGCYWREGKVGPEPLSNFILAPERRIKVESQEVLEARVRAQRKSLLAGTGTARRLDQRSCSGRLTGRNKMAFRKCLGDLGGRMDGQ